MDQRFAFVVRIWLTESLQPQSQKGSHLRGTLQDIHSAESHHFNSLRQLNDLLEMAMQNHEANTASTSD